MFRRATLAILSGSVALAIGAGGACSDTTGPGSDPMDPMGDPPMDADTYTLTFQGDASFLGPHGGQPISVAVVEPDAAVPVRAVQSGTVAASGNPTFVFQFSSVLEEGHAYRVDYWVDANFGGGSKGVCDPPPTDHQWSDDLGVATQDVALTVSHDAGALTDVCDTFN